MDPASDAATWRCPAESLGPGQTASFRLGSMRALVVNHEGRYHAYVNRCPHAGTPLDLWPNEFWTEDGRYLICATHGAIFAPDTGVCVEGPCPGARLERLAVSLDGDAVVVSRP